MLKRLLCFCFALLLVSAGMSALAAHPAVTILPYTDGSVTLIGSELVLTPLEGYHLEELYIDGEPVEPAPRVRLEEDRSYTVRAVFAPDYTEPVWENPYSDVSENDWFFEAVRFMDEKGLINGTGGGLFSPHEKFSRAMAVTLLFRLRGEPETAQPSRFDDVPENEWYFKAVSWATERGIVKGYGDGTFRPDDLMTREELATLLFGYARSEGRALTFTGDLSAFPDAQDISDWALTAVKWAVSAGIVEGRDDGCLDPGGTAERCEAVVMLSRYLG